MTASGLLIPVVGLVSAPILAHGLDVAGRGVFSAATAPNALVVGVATLGLPEALTFFTAKRPVITRRALSISALANVLLGLLCFGVVWLTLPFLSSGESQLGTFILVATAIAIPQLVVNLLRGAATGRQMWGAVATERISSSLVRLGALGLLLATGHLTVFSAVLVTTIGALVGGLAYWRVFLQPSEEQTRQEGQGFSIGAFFSFGVRVWIGSVAGILLARIGLLLFAPLSTVSELGLFVVAVTISDVPLLVSLAIRDALYGVNSKTADSDQLVTTTRVTLMLAIAGSLVLGATMPLWLAVVFGDGFAFALFPTLVLLAASVVNIPGFLAAAGLGAWGRPGLRSLGLGLTLPVYVCVFVLLVPGFGAMGAAISGLAGALFSTGFMVLATSRVLGVRPAEFLVPRRRDVDLLAREGRLLLGQIKSKFSSGTVR